MATTTNYGWDTPDDTDLVKDGAAAIRTLGSSIDTTTKNLNPQTTTGALAYRSATANVNTALPIGTAGQILAVSGGVPAWINNDQGDITEVQAGTGISVASGTGPIPVVTNTVATAYDAKADLIVGTGADTFARLAVGTNGHTLVADSSVSPTGLKWAAPSSGNFVKAAYGQTSSQVATTSTTYADTGVTATITPSSASNDIYVICRLVGYYLPGTSSSSAGVRLMRDATQIAEDSNVFITATGYGGSMEMTMIYKDSPATTSATTYKTQQKVMATTATITTQPNSMLSTIMLIEVTP